MGIVSSAKKIAKTPAVQQSVKTNKLLKEYEDWASANGITRKPTTATSKLTIPEWGDNFTAEQKSVMNAMYTDIMYQNDIASFERQRTLGQKNTPYASAPSTPPISHTSSNTSAAAPSVSYKPQTAAEHIAVPNNGTFARTSLFTAAGDNALPALSTNTRNISSSQISRPSTSVTAPASTYSDLQSRMSILRQEIQDETDSTRRDELTKEYNSIKDYAAQNYQQGAKSRLADMSVNRTQLETRKTWLENQKAELQKQYAISVTQNAGNATSANTNANFDQTLSEITDPFVRQKVLEARRQYNNNPDQYNATALNADAAQAYQKLGAVNSELSSINAQLDQLKNSGEGYFLTKNAENGYTDMQYQPDFSGAKQAIVFIDNPQNSNPASATRKIVVSDSEYWGLMTDTEKQTMNYIAEKQGNDAAAKYVSEYLMPSLLQRRYEAQKSALPYGQDITFGQGVALFGASTVANFLSSPKAAANMYAQRMMRGLSGNEYNAPLNAYNAAAYETQLSNDVMSGTLGQDLNDRFGTVELPIVGERGLGDLVSMGSSTVQSVATALLGSAGFGAVGLGAMGSAVTMQSYYDGISRGLSEDQALAYAAASGIAEVLTEKVSLESILNVDSGQALLKILKQAGVEGSEEIASQLLQTAADEIISGDKSQLSQAVATYMDQGMTYDQAKKAAGNDWLKDTLFQGLAGFAQGGVMAGAARGFSAAYNSAQTRRDNRTSQTQETPVQPSQAPTGTSPSPGTPAAAKEAADALTSAMKQSEDAETYAVNSDGERNIVTPLIIKNVGTDETSVTVRDAQGSTFSVPLSEVEFATNMGDDYAYAAGMANDEVANAFLAYVGDAAHKEDIAAGMNFVYERAAEGRKLESIQKSVIAQPLNEQQFRAAYDLGVNQRTEKIAQEQAAATERRKNLPFKVGTIDYGEIDMASLNETQRERATLAAEIVSLSGVNVHLYESKPGADGMFRGADGELAPNGYYVGSTGDIFLDINAGRNISDDVFEQSAIVAVAAHEMTHRAKAASPALYNQYVEAAMWYMEQDGVDIDALIESVMSRDKSVTTREIAMEEIAANVAAPLLGTTDFVDKLYAARPQQALTLGQKIVEFIKKLKDRITRAYKGVTMPKEARLVMKNLDEIGKLWSDMMADAARLNETETQEAPAEAAPVAEEAPADADVRYSVRERDAEYLAAVERGDMDTAQKMVDEAAKAAGYTLKGYHTSKSAWTVFDMSKAKDSLFGKGAYFSTDKPLGQDYGDITRAFYLSVNNPLVLPESANGIKRLFDKHDIPYDGRLLESFALSALPFDTYEYFMEMRKFGEYSGLKESVERAGFDGIVVEGTGFAIAYAPDQIKSADPVTYSDDGSVIPLSERFNPASEDIRFSARATDEAYLSAVESGDMETAQRMVDEAAERAGYTLRGYHGTSQPTRRYDRAGYGDEKDYKNKRLPFTVFKTGQNGNIYMATNRQVADAIKGRFDGVPGTTMGVFVRFENPFVAKEHIYTSVPFYYNIPTPTEMRSAGYKKADVSTEEISAYARENGYDGVIIEGIREGAGTYTDDYIAFGSNQIKLSDPVVYDDSGSVIPLSERFNAGNEDIRYSVRDSGEVDSDGNALTEAQARFFRGSVIRDEEGNLIPMYHGTTAYREFTEFKRGKRGWLGAGIYFTSDKNYAQRYAEKDGPGGRMYSVYLDVKNPLVVTSNNPVPEVLEAATGRKNTYANRSAKQANDAQLITPADIKKLEAKGYDGIVWKFGGTYEVSVFSANQAKRVDNQSPTPSNDIRYSQRDPEDISTREVLATALEGAAQNEREKKMLAQYKDQIKKYDGIQKDIAEKRSRIRELTFGKYERTTATRDELTKLKNQVSVLWDQLSRQDSTLLKLEAMEPLKTLGEREQSKAVAKVRAEMNERIKAIREQRDAKVEQTKREGRERVQRMREGRKETEIRGKIKEIINDLNKRLLTPVEGRYVPKQFTQLVVNLGELVQTRSKEPTSAKASEKLAAISKAYAKLKEDPNFGGVYSAAVEELIDHVAGLVEGKTIYQLDSRDLEELYVALRAARKMIVDAVKVFGDEKKRSATKLGAAGIEELRRSRGNLKLEKAEKYFSSLLSTRSMFMRFGNQEEGGAWETSYKILNAGEHQVQRIIMDANAIFKDVIEGKANQKELERLQSIEPGDLVDVGLKDKDGNAVKITRDMMLELYKDLMNDQNIAHVMYGGMTSPDLKKFYDGDANAWGQSVLQIAGFGARFAELEKRLNAATTDAARAAIQNEYNNVKAQGDAYIASMRDVISGMLTPYEKRLLDAMHQYYDVYSKDTLNKVTEELYGFKKATIDNYFPIRTNKNFRKANFETITRDFTLANSGFMKSRVNASNPILLGGILETTRIHIQQMAQYAGLVIPLSDFSKIYSTTLSGYSDSLQNALVDAFDLTGTKWVENYLADLNHARKREHTVFDAWRGRYAKAILTFNIPSALKQVTAYPTAASVVGWGPTLKALARGGRGNAPISRANRALIDKYSTVLYSASRGLTSAELGDVRENMKWGARFNKAIDFLQKLDVATRGRMWDAARYYVDENFAGLEKGTQEQIDAGESPYYKKVAEVFDKVVEDTQQSYSASQLPDILRSPNALIRSMTMFMTQPLKNLGVLYDAAANMRAKARAVRLNDTKETRAQLHDARVRFANSVSAQVTALIFEKIMSLAGMMLLYKVNPLRDDDDDITWESVLEWFGWDTLNSVLGSFAFGRELADTIEGFAKNKQPYEIEVMGVSSISSLVQTTYRAWNDISKMATDKDYEWPTNFHDAALKWGNGPLVRVATDVGNLFGVPVGNVLNIVKAGYFHAVDAAEGALGSFEAGIERTDKYYYGQLYNLAAAGDKAGFNARLAEVMEEREVTESDALSGVRSAIGEAYLAGEIDALTANALLADYVGERDKDRKKTLGEWNYKRDTGESYADMKELYLDGSLTLSQAVEARVKYGMIDRASATETVNQWRYELDTGRKWDEMGADMLNGKITEAAAKNYLTKYGGKSNADANEKINEWIYEDETGRDFTRYSYVYDALDAGSKATFNAAVSDMVSDYGMERDDVVKQAASHIETLVGDGELTPARALSLRESVLGETFTDVERNLQLNEYEYILANGSGDGYTKYGKYHDALYKAMQDSDTAAFEKAMQTTISETGLSETDVYEDVRGLVRKAMTSGEIDAETAREYITSFGGKEANEAYWTVREWEYGINGGEGSFSRYNDFLGAIETGNGLTGYATELLDHGTDRSTIARQISDVYRKEYIRLKETNPTAANALLNKILPAYEAIGYSREYEIDYISKNWK